MCICDTQFSLTFLIIFYRWKIKKHTTSLEKTDSFIEKKSLIKEERRNVQCYEEKKEKSLKIWIIASIKRSSSIISTLTIL